LVVTLFVAVSSSYLEKFTLIVLTEFLIYKTRFRLVSLPFTMLYRISFHFILLPVQSAFFT